MIRIACVMSSRRKGASTGVSGCVLTSCVLPVTLAATVQLTPSRLTLIEKSWVFHIVDSPPDPAWSMTTELMCFTEPRSSCHHLSALLLSHHLSLVPPSTVPLIALLGFSSSLHDPLAVAVP